MKCLKKLQICLLISIVISLMLPSTAFAQEAGYTYQVTLYAGNQGVLTDDVEKLQDGILVETSGDDIAVEHNDGKIVISGLHYNDRISFRAQTIAEVSNEKYYVSGIRKSGRDNSELELSSYQVKGDKDYVIAYAIRGNMVLYTVNYQDVNGNALLESNTFYGNVGEKPVIAYRYVDGYRPQAYNLTKILSANEEENEFTFVYEKLGTNTTVVEDEVEEETLPENTLEGTDEEEDRLLAPIKQVITIIRNVVADDNGTGSGNGNNSGSATDNQNTGDGNGAGEAGTEGAEGAAGDEAGEGENLDSTDIFEDETPLSLLELIDEEVPLTNISNDDTERPGTEPNLLPIYAGIGIIALLALIFLFLFIVLKKKKEDSEDNNEQAEKTE